MACLILLLRSSQSRHHKRELSNHHQSKRHKLKLFCNRQKRKTENKGILVFTLQTRKERERERASQGGQHANALKFVKRRLKT